jgi:endo-1,4-beta-xylanase
MKKILSLSVVVLLLFASCSDETLSKDDLSSQGVEGSHLKAGNMDHGYFYAFWYIGSGSANISFPYANQWPGNFSVSYNNIGNVVSGKGWNPGSARTVNYNVGTLSGSYNLVAVYGWTTNPLIEYYVCEFGSNIAGSYINTINSDGHNYNFYKHLQVNQPSIVGTATFWQYLDNWGGSSTGQNRTVNMANHINNWRSRGGQGFGNYNYQVLAIEAWGGRSGYINATVW